MFRKSILTASASALMLFGITPASAADLYEPALPDLSAVMSLYAGGAALNTSGGSNTDSDYGQGSHWLAGGDARVAGQSWQLELVAGALGDADSCSDCDEAGSNYLALAGHMLGRGETGTWGVFGGFAHVGHQDTQDTSGSFFGGVEYAHFMGNSTLFGQLGGTFAIVGETSDTWERGGFGRLGWRYFWTDHSKLEIDGMVGFGVFDANSTTGVTAGWGAEFEHQFSAPFSGFIAYSGHYVEHSSNNSCCEDYKIVSHALLLGFRVDVNSESLFQRDRSGAGTFNIPDLHRAYAWPDEL